MTSPFSTIPEPDPNFRLIPGLRQSLLNFAMANASCWIVLVVHAGFRVPWRALAFPYAVFATTTFLSLPIIQWGRQRLLRGYVGTFSLVFAGYFTLGFVQFVYFSWRLGFETFLEASRIALFAPVVAASSFAGYWVFPKVAPEMFRTLQARRKAGAGNSRP